MKFFKYTIYLLTIGFLVSACNFLDKEPAKMTQDGYFNSETEAYSFLTGIYAILGQSSFYGEDYLCLVGGDDIQHYGGASTRAPMNRGLICANTVSSDPAVTALWFTLYAGINRANIFLENIGKVTEISDDKRNQYISEARFLRAFFYFTLVQNWGDVPFKENSTKGVVNLDIPRTDRQQIYDFIITEMSEAADKETGGLLSAEALGKQVGRVSRSAAWAMIARVYLFRAGEHFRQNRPATQEEQVTYFQKASEYARMVMNENYHDLVDNYWDVFIDLCSNEYNSTDKNESIWEVEFAGNGTSDARTEGRWGNTCGLAGPDLSNNENIIGKADPGYSYEQIFATPKLYQLYTANGDLKRFYWNLAQFKYVEEEKNTGVTGRLFRNGTKDYIINVLGNWGRGTYSYGDAKVDMTDPKKPVFLNIGDYDNPTVVEDQGLACAKFRREYEADKKGKTFTSINFPLMRYSDVLLMIAEAENEANAVPTTLAYECLNDVRYRAGIATIPEGSLDKDGFRQAVKDERAMELCFELTRRHDLIRWGEFVTNMKEIPVKYNDSKIWKQINVNPVLNYFSNVDEKYNYFPIPDQEMSVNKKITENNPGW